MKEQKFHIRGSQAAFCEGRDVISDYGTGCYRKQVLISYGLEEPFPEKLAKIGAVNEVNYELQMKSLGHEYQREVEVCEPVTGKVTFNGRIDFWRPTMDYKIVELKSMTSEKSYKKVFGKGFYKYTNLAQLSSYMISKEQDSGLLIYTFYIEEEGVPIEEWKWESRAFTVHINEEGKIHVDSQYSGFDVADLLRQRYNSAMALLDVDVPSRPKDYNNKWKSPCTFCVHKKVCDAFDQGLIKDRLEFIEQATINLGEVK